MIKSFFEHFQAVFVAFLCRGSDIIPVTLEPCICPILEVQDRVQRNTAYQCILIFFQFELDLLLGLAIEGLEARRTIFLVASIIRNSQRPSLRWRSVPSPCERLLGILPPS